MSIPRPVGVVRRFAAICALLVLPVAAVVWARLPQDSGRTRLILVLSIDQMRADYLTRFDDLFQGGFRTLIDDGAVFTNAMYRHASTETGPGHSVILSGRHPSSSGIVGNSWFDPLLGRSVNVIEDPFVDLVGAQGRGASPVNFVGYTLGDALKQSSPNSKIVGVSMKDRSAILMAGRLADGAFWYDSRSGHFISSTWYGTDLPEWLGAWNQLDVAATYAGTSWTRLVDDEALYERYAGPDDVEGEGNGPDALFPHTVAGTAGLSQTPFADEITADVALEALKGYDLGEDADTDILAIGFSGTDYVGHRYGPDSQEVMDQLLRLDRTLGDFLGEVDRLVGLDRTLIVLTADHGVLPLVEVLQARGVDARRVNPASLQTRVLSALGERYEDPRSLIASFGADGLTFNHQALRARGVSPNEVESVSADALRGMEEVAAVYTRADLAGTRDSEDPYLWLYRNAFFPARSPDLTIRLQPFFYPSGPNTGGTGHGTAYDYDRHVPIVFLGTGIPSRAFDAEAGPEDIAPTLAAMLGLGYPIEPDARILSEILP
jgi:predicted AlkP superfamily pyrophosphatase or phosphodiesterase